jgi:type IV secretory pathway VirB6-like protein
MSSKNTKRAIKGTIAATVLLLYFFVWYCAQTIDTVGRGDRPSKCIAAGDFIGDGPSGVSAESDCVKERNSFQCKKYNIYYTRQKWKDIGLYTTGVSTEDGRRFQGIFRALVRGEWYPWGSGEEECPYIHCDPNNSEHSPCLEEGFRVDEEKAPCKVSHGIGLYGLIKLDTPECLDQDPNDPDVNVTGPCFRSFHMAAFQKGASGARVKTDTGDSSTSVKIGVDQYKIYDDEGAGLFEVDFTQLCAAGVTTCEGKQPIPKGKIYFKISDTYYEDNGAFVEDEGKARGGYQIQVLSGAYAKETGIIETIVNFFIRTLNKVRDQLTNAVLQDSGFISLVRAMLALYILFSGFGIMIGIIEATQAEVIIRIVKVGFMLLLISDTSMNFFNQIFFPFFTEVPGEVASMILRATVLSDPRFYIPVPDNYLSIFDALVKILLSQATHSKIWALFFYKWYFVYIPLIYCGAMFIVMGIIQAVMMFTVAFFIQMVLMVSAPIFFIFLLFGITKHLFEKWLTQMIANAVTVIMVAAVISLMMGLVMSQLQELLYFKVCFSKIGNFFFFIPVHGWYPGESSEVDEALTPTNFFAFLMIAYLFNKIIKQVPQIVDALAQAQLQPLKGGMNSMAAFGSSAKSTIMGDYAGMRRIKGAINNEIQAPVKQAFREGMDYLKDTKLWKGAAEARAFLNPAGGVQLGTHIAVTKGKQAINAARAVFQSGGNANVPGSSQGTSSTAGSPRSGNLTQPNALTPSGGVPGSTSAPAPTPVSRSNPSTSAPPQPNAPSQSVNNTVQPTQSNLEQESTVRRGSIPTTDE